MAFVTYSFDSGDLGIFEMEKSMGKTPCSVGIAFRQHLYPRKDLNIPREPCASS